MLHVCTGLILTFVYFYQTIQASKIKKYSIPNWYIRVAMVGQCVLWHSSYLALYQKMV